MSTHPQHPKQPAGQAPAVEVRLTDPGGQQLAFTWQVLDGHGRLLASGQVAGAPNTPELAGWRYHAFTEAAQAAITALQHLEATQRRPDPAEDHHAGPAGGARTCDFCAAERAAWRYPTRHPQPTTIRLDQALILLPGGDWYACPACHLLVAAGQWDVLSQRAHLPAEQGAALWATFQACRAGTPTPLHPSPHDQDGGASR